MINDLAEFAASNSLFYYYSEGVSSCFLSIFIFCLFDLVSFFSVNGRSNKEYL